MKNDKLIEARVIEHAELLIYNDLTIREIAKKTGWSKTTVQRDLSKKLEKINNSLFLEVQQILFENFNEKHIRGGIVTRLKYKKNN